MNGLLNAQRAPIPANSEGLSAGLCAEPSASGGASPEGLGMNGVAAAFVAGLVFALGLGVSGMTDANKVIGFLNLAGVWDPSLGFVMVGAIGVHRLVYRLIVQRKSPLFADAFQIPSRRDIGKPLVGGAALFGVGWGLGGTCPGPGLVSAAGFASSAVVFVVCMLAGMLIHKFAHRHKPAEVASDCSKNKVEALCC